MPVGYPKNLKPCTRCGEPHHHFARCADGVLLGKRAAPFGSPERAARDAAKAAETDTIAPLQEAAPETSPDPVPPPALITDAETARAELRAMVEALPEGSPQRASLALLLERDEARTAHAQAEADLRVRNPEARLALPNILRERDEKAGRALESELNRVLAVAQQAIDPRARPPREEVMLVKETLAGIPAKRDAEESAARDAAKGPEIVTGETVWLCENPGAECRNRSFRAPSMEYVRKKAAAEPTWKFVCPRCKGIRVRLSELQELAS